MTNPTLLAAEGGPLVIDKAEGIYVTDVDGQRFLDGISGMYFRNAGHGREEIARAIYEQLSSVSMNVYAGVTPAAIRLATLLAQRSPGDLSRTFFCQRGSEANESSMKLAQAYHVRRGERGRYKVISRRGSYHGATWARCSWASTRSSLARIIIRSRRTQSSCPARTFIAVSSIPPVKRSAANWRHGPSSKAILSAGRESVSAVIGEPVTQPRGGVVPVAYKNLAEPSPERLRGTSWHDFIETHETLLPRNQRKTLIVGSWSAKV